MHKLIVALDVPTVERAWAVVDALEGLEVSWKVGLHLILDVWGPSLVERLAARGDGVMLDLKMCDIPSTMEACVRRAGNMGVELATLGAGVDAGQVQAAKLGQTGGLPHLVGVTTLTSSEATATGVAERAFDLVEDMGLDGVVCSGLEAAEVRSMCGPDLRIVCPGVRPEGWVEEGDQVRICSVREAIAAGADHVVVGRPIVGAPGMRLMAVDVLGQMEVG